MFLEWPWLGTSKGSEYLNVFARLVYYLTLGHQLWSDWHGKLCYSAGYSSYCKITRISMVWTVGSLKEVMAVSSPGMHACHCMLQSPCAAGRPPPLSSPWRNLLLSKQISASIWSKNTWSNSAHLKCSLGMNISTSKCQWFAWPQVSLHTLV